MESSKTIPFCGFHVMVVEPGTVVTDKASGVSHTVDETAVVFKGALVYCTQTAFDNIKKYIEENYG